MGTPGQDLISDGQIANADKARYNRFGIAVDGQPELISVAEPYESYEGTKKIDTPERVDLVISKRDNTRFSIKYRAD